MAVPLVNRKMANFLSGATFLLLFIIMAYYKHLWPGILLAFWAALALRQYLRGRLFDVFLTTMVFGGLFCTFVLIINWNALLPTILTIGAILIVYREGAFSKRRQQIEENEDLQRNPQEHKIITKQTETHLPAKKSETAIEITHDHDGKRS